MHDVFLFKFCIHKYFVRMLNSRGIRFENISENKVLANNSEFTVFSSGMTQITYEVWSSSGDGAGFPSILLIRTILEQGLHMGWQHVQEWGTILVYFLSLSSLISPVYRMSLSFFVLFFLSVWRTTDCIIVDWVA